MKKSTRGDLQRRKNAISRLARGILLGSVACTPGMTLAQTPSAAEPGRAALEEVIVTARKIAESSQSVPVAITAVSAKELAKSNIRDLADLNGYAPNVSINEDGPRAGGGGNIIIRGISPTRVDDNSFDSPIGVMIDGIYLGSMAGQVLENFDIERVEILRGPQGTLFGKNTVGGVVHVIRSRPTGEAGGRLKITVGEDGQREVRAVGNVGLIEDKLAAKVFYTSAQDDGFLENVTLGRKVPKRDYANYGLTLLATPTERFEAQLTVEKFKDQSELGIWQTNYNLAGGVVPPPSNDWETDWSAGVVGCIAWFPEICRTSLDRPNHAEHDKENDASLRTDAVTLNMQFQLNENLTLVSVTGYRDISEYRIYDFDASAAPIITIERWNKYDQFSEELRLDGHFGNVTFTAGAYYWESDFTQDWVTGDTFWSFLFGAVAYDPASWQACIAGALAPIWCDSGIPNGVTQGDIVTQVLYETQKTKSWAGFVQADWQFAEDWTLTLGVRQTKEKKHFIAGQAYLSNVERQRERNFPGYADLNNTWNDTSPKLGLTYQWNEDTIVYVTYAKGFHSGGFFGVNQNIRDFERDQYDPEKAESWELGIKSTMLDGRLRINADVFLNDFTDKQEQSIQVDPDTKTVATTFDNVADAEYKGVEIEIQALLTDNLKVWATYGYLDASFKDFVTDIDLTDGVTILEDASFLTPRNAPKNTWGVGGTLTVPVGNGEIEFNAKYAWTDERETLLLNEPLSRRPSAEELSANVGYHAEKWSVVAFGRNLTNDRYEDFYNIGTLFAVGSVNRPRSYGVEVTMEF